MTWGLWLVIGLVSLAFALAIGAEVFTASQTLKHIREDLREIRADIKKIDSILDAQLKQLQALGGVKNG